MHITLTGNLGSGKSTICKILENNYGYEIYSTGKVQRSIAEGMGISVLEMNQLMRSDHKYDHLIDDETARISRENPDKAIVFDSRLAWHFVERSFKVFLSVSLDVAAERVFHDNRGDVEKYASLEDTKEQLRQRAAAEDVRYREIYGLNYFDFHNYDLILDSTYCAPEVLARLILEEAEAYEKQQAEAGKEIGQEAGKETGKEIGKETEKEIGKETGRAAGAKILISPRRLGLQAAEINPAAALYPEWAVKVRKGKEDFEIAEGREAAGAAAAAGMPFIRAELVSSYE